MITVNIFKAYGTWYAVPANNPAPLYQRCPLTWNVELDKVLAFLDNLRIPRQSIQNLGETKKEDTQ